MALSYSATPSRVNRKKLLLFAFTSRILVAPIATGKCLPTAEGTDGRGNMRHDIEVSLGSTQGGQEMPMKNETDGGERETVPTVNVKMAMSEKDYRELKAKLALRGINVKTFVTDAVLKALEEMDRESEKGD
jgi:hypothetical protein